jgi:hypothetical protein
MKLLWPLHSVSGGFAFFFAPRGGANPSEPQDRTPRDEREVERGSNEFPVVFSSFARQS